MFKPSLKKIKKVAAIALTGALMTGLVWSDTSAGQENGRTEETKLSSEVKTDSGKSDKGQSENGSETGETKIGTDKESDVTKSDQEESEGNSDTIKTDLEDSKTDSGETKNDPEDSKTTSSETGLDVDKTKEDSESSKTEKKDESGSSEGTTDKKDDEEKSGTALYFIAHQDDEMLTFSAGILNDLADGLDVQVVLVTDGSSSGAYKKLKKKGYSLTVDEFVAARDLEFTEALKALGVPEENIHIPSNRIADGKGTESESQLREIMETYLDKYPEAEVRTSYPNGEIQSEHKDHGCLGDMAITLKKEGVISSLRLFVDPYYYSQYIDDGMPSLSTFKIDISKEATSAFENAVAVYKKWNPENSYYGIGNLSASSLFEELETDRVSYYFDYHNEGLVRYGGSDRYETVSSAVTGNATEGTSEVNFAAPTIEQKSGKAPNKVEDTSSITVYKDRVYAPHQGKGTEMSAQGSSDTAGGTIVVALATNFPDALSATSLGYEILLTRTDSLPDSVREEILRIMPERIIVVGADKVVSQSVFKELEDIAQSVTASELKTLTGCNDLTSSAKLVYNPTVVRWYGNNRQLTALEIMKQSGFNSSTNTIIVATGNDFADALSIAPYAAKTHSPILLCSKGELNEDAYDAIKKLENKCTQVIIVGASNVVSSNVMTRLSKMGKKVIRLYGYTRYETSAKIVEYEIKADVGLSISHFSVATGKNFPDALVAGPVTANNGSVLLLTNEKTASWSDNISILHKYRNEIASDYRFYIYGSEAAVSRKVENIILTAIG